AATPRALRPPAPRTSLATASSSPVAPVTPRQSRPPLPDGPAILVRYLAGAPVRIVGAVTGRHYEFRPAAPTRLVAREDAIALLASPSFRPA
ncbi:MAG TPA: hypothetical protein VKZ18_09140, partial [Polyangia bacterium]|nr:hypothetical protein [Polyangia bacterium]